MGEPLLHPELDAILAEAEKQGFRVCITTNGTLLRPRGGVLLEHSAVVHKVSVSLHALEGSGCGMDMEEYLSYSFKPQFKVLGPKVGKQIGEVKAALAAINGHAAKAELESTGKLKLSLKSGEVELAPEDVDITMSQTEGFATQRYGNVTIALETTLSQELIEEGFVREIISKLQTMRKENGFEVVDHIAVYAAGNDKLTDIMSRNEDILKKVVLADSITYGNTNGFVKEWNINGEDITLAIK